MVGLGTSLKHYVLTRESFETAWNSEERCRMLGFMEAQCSCPQQHTPLPPSLSPSGAKGLQTSQKQIWPTSFLLRITATSLWNSTLWKMGKSIFHQRKTSSWVKITSHVECRLEPLLRWSLILWKWCTPEWTSILLYNQSVNQQVRGE